MHKDQSYGVILDTSFFIRLLSAEDKLHSNAVGYFKFFGEWNTYVYLYHYSCGVLC